MPKCYALKTVMGRSDEGALTWSNTIYRFPNCVVRDMFVKKFRLDNPEEITVKSVKRKDLEENFGIFNRDKLGRERFGKQLLIDGAL